MSYETKTVNGFDYQIRFATFKPKTMDEAAKALEVDIENPDNTDDIEYVLENGIESEALVPIVKSLDDIVSLSTGNVYNEQYLVDCFTHGIAIKDQAKSRLVIENLARPKKSKLTKELYNKMFNKITETEWKTITTSDNKAKSLQNCIDIHFEIHQQEN